MRHLLMLADASGWTLVSRVLRPGRVHLADGPVVRGPASAPRRASFSGSPGWEPARISGRPTDTRSHSPRSRATDRLRPAAPRADAAGRGGPGGTPAPSGS